MTRMPSLASLLPLCLLAACTGDTEGVRTTVDRTDVADTSEPGTTIDPTDTGNTTDPSGGPNLSTDSTNQRCLLLYGQTDRMSAGGDYLPVGTTSRTLQAWVRTNQDNEQVAVSYGRGSVGQGFTIGVARGGFPFVDNNGSTRIEGDTRIDDDEWHHLVGMWDGSTGYLVVDGVLEEFGALPGDTQSGGITVGNRTEASVERDPWIGWIDDVKLFTATRDVDDIALDPDGEDLEASRLKVWYDFENVGTDEEGPGVEVDDLSGNGHTGTTAGTGNRPQFPFCR